MGYTVELICNECKYRKVFNFGRASVKEPINEVLKEFPTEVGSTIKQLDAAYGMTGFDYGDQAVVCNECKEISSKMILRVKFSNELDYTSKYFCSSCNSKLKIIENHENLDKCNCPSCGSLSLKHKDICNWG
jgi:DNA-directed RNA polymerase subunit RPC12/RpoP